MSFVNNIVLLPIFFFFNDTATTEIYTLSLHDALPIWRRRRVLPPEAGTRASGLCRGAVRAVPERALDGVRARRQRGRARVGDQPRLHRAAHVELACPRDRGAGLPADRPRPDLRRPVAVRPRDRARRA